MAKAPRRSANAAARNRLIEENPQRFRELQLEEYGRRGLALELTPEEKAEQRARQIFADYPHLRTKLLPDPDDYKDDGAAGDG